MDSPANDPEMQKLIAMEVADIMEGMTTPTNWPDPARPGVPMFPERDGWHWIDAGTGHVRPLNWCCRSQGWYSSPKTWVGCWKYNDKWTYHGPCLTPAQIAEMLVAERKALKEKSWVYAQDDGENVAGNVEDLLEYNDEYEIVNVGEAAEIDDYYAFKDRDNTIHKLTTRKEAEEAIRNLGDAP